MNISKAVLAEALLYFSIIGVVAGLLISFVAPAKAFYGSLNRDGNPVWECYDHPERC